MVVPPKPASEQECIDSYEFSVEEEVIHHEEIKQEAHHYEEEKVPLFDEDQQREMKQHEVKMVGDNNTKKQIESKGKKGT